jgi:hypothetical protein
LHGLGERHVQDVLVVFGGDGVQKKPSQSRGDKPIVLSHSQGRAQGGKARGSVPPGQTLSPWRRVLRWGNPGIP